MTIDENRPDLKPDSVRRIEGDGVATARVTTDQLEIVYRDEGDRNPPDGSLPLLMLHGAVQTRRIWDAQMPALSRDRRVIAPDLRGHGETTGPVAGMTIERLAADAFGLLDALGIDRAIVCGVSLGGMVALEMAAMRPLRVAALVVADTPLALSLKPFVRRLIDAAGPQRLLGPLFGLFGQRRTGHIGLALVRGACGRGWVGAEAERHFIQGFAAMSPAAIIATYGAIVAADPAAIRRLSMPCLVVFGRRETSMVLEHAEIIARRIEGAQIVTLDAGHVANLDDPVGFGKALGEFLETYQARAKL